MSGSPNLVTLHLDLTTGNLVAKPPIGTYFPPSGTGFQFVTGGVPSLTAVTPTAATALLNLFTSSLQGLVPASGGGTSTFLRADGTWVVPTSVLSFNTRTGAVTLSSADVGVALGYVAYNGTANPNGFLTSSTSITAVTAGTGIGVVNVSTPKINLATAVTYGVGAFSTIANTGTTNITGNVFLSPAGSITGSPTVSGTTHNGDTPAATALTDANNAFIAGNALVGYITIPAELGLTSPSPGLYTTSSSFRITGTLTLNGNATDVWVFKSPSSTLVTAASSSVVLTGGALPQNVYWLVGSTATLGTLSTFIGTVIAHGSISDTGGSTVNGHMFALTAAVTLNNTTVTTTPAGSGLSSVVVSNPGVLSFNTRTGAVTLTSGDVTTALTFTPYNATNPSGFISALPAFTATGDVSGTFVPGSPGSIVLTLPNIATAGTFTSVTVNTKGQVTAGTSPTTLAGLGITDGVSSQVSTILGTGVSLTFAGSGSITFAGGGTIHGLPTPVNPGDAANKAYVDVLNPMTTAGDIVYENATPIAARLPIGTTGQVLTVVSGLPAWSTPPVRVYNYTAVPAAATFQVANATWNQILDLTSNTSSTFTASLPATPIDGQVVTFSIVNSGGVTTFVIAASQSIVTSGLGTTTQKSYIYRLSNTTWYQFTL